MRLRFLLLFLSLVTATSCTAEDKFESSTFFYEPIAQQALRQELDKSNIPYRVDEKGTVWYRIQDTDKVMSIRKKIINEVLMDKYGTSFTNQEEERLFTEALKKNGIHYDFKEQHGRRWVTWAPEDDKRVRKIENEIDSMMSKKLSEQRRRMQEKSGSE